MEIKCVKVGYLKENCYVISYDNECLVIDPGDEPEKIKQLIGNKRLLGILITHYHFDHIGALDELKKRYNSPVIDFKSDLNQVIGPFNFSLILTPGHKEDSVTYYFKEEKVMFVGDFIFKESIGRCDLEGGSFKNMNKSIKKIKLYDKDITLYPGHGDKTTLGYETHKNIYFGGNYE